MDGLKVSIKTNSLCEQNNVPIDGLRGDVQAIIEEYSEVYQCSRDFIVSAMFSIVGSCLGKRLIIYDGKYRNFPCLWIAIVAKSGTNKSAPIKSLLQPVRDVDAENYKTYKHEHKEWRDNGEQGQKPSFVQHLINDSTPEARNQVLSRNPNGILLYRDEIKGFLDDIGRYNKSGEISQMLSMFDADDVTINRKTDEPILIQRPFMSILGSIQPDVLSSTFGSDLLMSNGFNQRWLFCYPDECPPAMYSDSTISQEVKNDWNGCLKGLMAKDTTETLLLDDRAKEAYKEYYDRLQRKKADAGNYMAAVYSKLQIQVLRWSGIAHLLGDNSFGECIMPQDMEYSVRCMDYFERCAEKVYGKLMEGRKPGVKPLGREQMIANVYHLTNPVNQSAVADALGVTKQYISKCLKKYPRLTGCRLTDSEYIEDEVITDKTASTT